MSSIDPPGTPLPQDGVGGGGFVRDLILAPSQAMAKNKKLAKGFRFVSLAQTNPPAAPSPKFPVPQTPVRRSTPNPEASVTHALERRLRILKAEVRKFDAQKAKSTPKAPTKPSPKPRELTLPVDTSSPITANSPQNASAATPLSRRSGRVPKPPRFPIDDSALSNSDALLKCRELHTMIMSQKFSYIFNIPVDWEALHIPDYPKIVKKPMDLGTIKDKLFSGAYSRVEDYANDVRLVWKNATAFNPPSHMIHLRALEYDSLFEKKLQKLLVTEAQKIDKQKNKEKKAKVKAEAVQTPVSSSKKGKGRGPLPVPSPGDDAAAALVAQLEAMKKQIAGLKSKLDSYSRHGQQKKSLDATPLTKREKKMLKDEIMHLPSNKLGPVVAIINKHSPESGKDSSGEIELDLDSLTIPALRELQRYVKRQQQAAQRKSRGGPGKSPPTGDLRSPNPSASPAMNRSLQSPSPQTLMASPRLDDYDMLAASPSVHHQQLLQKEHLELQQQYSLLQQQQQVGGKAGGNKSGSDSDDSDSDSDSSSSSGSDSEDGQSSKKRKTGVTSSTGSNGSNGHNSGNGNGVGPNGHVDATKIRASPPTPTGAGGFGDPTSSLYARKLSPADNNNNNNNQPSKIFVGLEPAPPSQPESEVVVNVDAWQDLAVRTEPASAPAGQKEDEVWASFRTRDQELREKEQQRRQVEEKLRKEREKASEELKRRAEEARRRQEEEEQQLRKAAKEAELARQREIEQTRERARLEREKMVVTDLQEQRSLMDMMEGMLGQ